MGGGTWQPLLDDAVGRSYMFTTCHLGLVFPPAAMLWTIVPGGVIPVPTAPICQIPRETHSLDIQVVGSIDPNEKLGSNGAGAEKYLSSIEPLRYTILFENLETATAPAQEILIVDQLDAVTMDFSSLKLGPITFGQTIISPPTGSQSFSTIVDLRPDNNLLIRLDIGLDQDTGLLTWSFVATDPVTGQLPEDPLAGFLPPNVTPPEGDGSVLFTVMPKQGLPTDTEIRNSASIVFDTNAPILTPEWLNTLDNNKPSSAVIPLALTQSTTSFNVEWSGIDQGAGIKDYTIWFSEDGGDFVPWLTNIAEVSATFSGGSGKTYAFYSVARDLTGNIEDIPGLADTNTAIDPDTDSDGLLDGVDNCILVSNPTQCDGDNDGYGNHCDADFNNDLIVNGLDIGLFKAGFGTTDVVTDLNCDGITNGLDIGLLKVLFGSPPGPSGLVP